MNTCMQHTTLILVPVDTIATLSTTNNLMISMNDEQVHYGRLRIKEGKSHLHPLDGSPIRPIDLAKISQALPIPTTPNPVEEQRGGEGWSAALDTGIEHRTGNRDRTEAFSRLTVSKISPSTEFNAQVKVEHDYQDGPSLLNATADLQRKGPAPLQPYGRTDLSLGIGKILFGESDHQLQGRLGLSLAMENWNLNQLTDVANQASDNEKFNRELNLQLGLRYSYALFGKGVFDQYFILYPSITEFGSIRSRSESAVRFLVTDHLHLRFDFSVEYDNEPEFQELDEWNTSVGASIQVEF
jgi:hypothetical protein